MQENVLDNPSWNALTTVHQPFAVGTDRVKRYRSGVLPFLSCHTPQMGGLEDLEPYILPGESFYLMGELPKLPPGWVMEHALPCAQMVFSGTPVTKTDNDILTLTAADADDMFELITSVQPGYYNQDTRLLGTYLGIREEGRLIAMAGERMRMTGFSELSAICTRPGYTGRGMAQGLIARLCQLQLSQGVNPFLHVAMANERAIRLYQHMGFTHRRQIIFYRLSWSPIR